MSSSPSVVSARREIHEGTWELLYIELIEQFSNSNLNEEDNNTAQKDQLIQAKLEKLGFQVGQRLIERYTRERPRFQDTLEIIKFICKEFWLELFKKQIESLRTNRRGVYVLHDAKFRWLQKLSGSTSGQAKEAGMKYLYFPSGIIRGALANLGVPCDVSAEILTLPSCNFTIKIKGV